MRLVNYIMSKTQLLIFKIIDFQPNLTLSKIIYQLSGSICHDQKKEPWTAAATTRLHQTGNHNPLEWDQWDEGGICWDGINVCVLNYQGYCSYLIDVQKWILAQLEQGLRKG